MADSLQGRERGADVAVDAVLEGAPGHREQDLHGHGPVVHADGLEHPQVLDGLADLGVVDLPERLSDLFLGDHSNEAPRG